MEMVGEDNFCLGLPVIIQDSQFFFFKLEFQKNWNNFLSVSHAIFFPMIFSLATFGNLRAAEVEVISYKGANLGDLCKWQCNTAQDLGQVFLACLPLLKAGLCPTGL